MTLAVAQVACLFKVKSLLRNMEARLVTFLYLGRNQIQIYMAISEDEPGYQRN